MSNQWWMDLAGKLGREKDGENSSLDLPESRPLQSKLEENIKLFRAIFDRCSDVQYRFLETKIFSRQAALIYIEGMVDKNLISQHAVRTLLELDPSSVSRAGDLLDLFKEKVLPITQVEETGDVLQASEGVLAGDALFLMDGCSRGLILRAKGFEIRTIEESASEQVIRGPRDGFVENVQVNASLLRRRLKSSRLKMEAFQRGVYSKTDIVVAYIDGVVDPGVLAEVKKRLTRIDIDAVLESSYLEEFMEDAPWSPFPQINCTDRPDKVVGGLLEGQVAILVDNTPFALLVPMAFPLFLHTSEDYYTRHLFASFTRLVRFGALNIALLLPSLYIAIVTFHQEMLPTSLLLSLAAGRERTPFPAFLEALLMETTFEILREAGVRLPRPVGQATSIVGALVIGDAAVTAGLVSPAMVIVVGLTALASFIIPTVPGSFSIRLLRFPIMFLAASLGLYGVMVALMAILIHLCALRSFGVPYLSPLAPTEAGALKDSFIRAPWWLMLTRPRFLSHQENKRQDQGQKPRTSPVGSRRRKRRGP
ncbi:MAG: spore germination protein [Bacillota bacterium]|jgi:spore germination protein KA